MNLSSINALKNDEAAGALKKCCGSERWVEHLLAGRPYESEQKLFDQCDQAFASLSKSDWLEAFAAHPRIGDVESLKAKYGATKEWAHNEQSGAQGISDQLAHDLKQLNEDYFQKFGYIFIVCATGKSAHEMLDILSSRIGNEAEEELRIASSEQEKITRLRLEKL